MPFKYSNEKESCPPGQLSIKYQVLANYLESAAEISTAIEGNPILLLGHPYFFLKISMTKQGCNLVAEPDFICQGISIKEREFGYLHNIKDKYLKYVVSMTSLVARDDGTGITHLHLRNFLMLDELD